MSIKSFMNWSGGKDSALCLYKILQNKNYSINCLLTNVNAAHDRISMHGVRRSLLMQQADSIGIPLQTIELPENPGMNEYEKLVGEKMALLKNDNYTTAVFGDIFLEDLKKYREQKLSAVDIDCIFPLWQHPVADLMNDFLSLGFKAIVVCVNEQYLDKSFCGRIIDDSFINDLPANVDVCGENGEYHSFVFDGPLFRYPVSFAGGGITRKTYPAPANNDRDCFKATSNNEYGFSFYELLPEGC